MSHADREFRTYNAIAQLQRYGPGLETHALIDVLEKLSCINDSIANGYSLYDVRDQVEDCKKLLDLVLPADLRSK